MKFGKLTPTDKARTEIEDIDKYIYDTEKRLMWEKAQLQHYRDRRRHLVDTYPSTTTAVVSINRREAF